jgi:hypothetical protein
LDLLRPARAGRQFGVLGHLRRVLERPGLTSPHWNDLGQMSPLPSVLVLILLTVSCQFVQVEPHPGEIVRIDAVPSAFHVFGSQAWNTLSAGSRVRILHQGQNPNAYEDVIVISEPDGPLDCGSNSSVAVGAEGTLYLPY